MKLAVINKDTNRVENIAVPPEGSNVWFVPDGFIGVLSEDAEIGDSYDGKKFIKPLKMIEVKADA